MFSIVEQATTSAGAFEKCSTESSAIAVLVSIGSPSFSRSRSQGLAIAPAKLRFFSGWATTMNRQGCALCAEGAHDAASRISRRTLVGIGCWLYFLMLRLSLRAIFMFDIEGQ